jgi:hypothetical protein
MYAGPVLFVVIAIVTTIMVYDSLPETLTTTWDFHNRPTGHMQKTCFVAVLLGYMVGMMLLFIVLDCFMVYPLFPVSLMSASIGWLELFCLLMHLAILDLGVIPTKTVFGTIILVLAVPSVYVAVHMKLFRGTMSELPQGVPLWVDNPPHGWLTTIFFFVRPILPREIIAYKEGLVVHASTYHFMIPWKQIRSVKHATMGMAMMERGVRLASSPSRSVEVSLVDGKLPLIFSIGNKGRLIAEWERRREAVSKNE